jgi:hypothetical protein
VFRQSLSAAGLVLLCGCSLTEQRAPPLAGPSEIGLSLALTATPDAVEQDGVSEVQVEVVARGAGRRPVPELSLAIEIDGGVGLDSSGTLDRLRLTTDRSGRAAVVYTSPRARPGAAVAPRTISIVVTPVGSDYANALPRSVQIRLLGNSGFQPAVVH